MNYKEIIATVNKRYVLYKPENEEYKIYDKLQGAFLYINDPIINYSELVKEIRRRSSKVYKSINDLPEPTQKLIDWTTKQEITDPNIVIRRMYDQNSENIGVVVTYQSNEKIQNLKEKELIEKRLIDYVHDKIFRNEGISVFKDKYRDNASIIAINNINDLQNEYSRINI